MRARGAPSPGRAAVVPVALIVAGVVLAVVMPEIDRRLEVDIGLKRDPDSARNALSATASGMIAFTGFVFSAVVLVVQFGSSAFSPRLLRVLRGDLLPRLAWVSSRRPSCTRSCSRRTSCRSCGGCGRCSRTSTRRYRRSGGRRSRNAWPGWRSATVRAWARPIRCARRPRAAADHARGAWLGRARRLLTGDRCPDRGGAAVAAASDRAGARLRRRRADQCGVVRAGRGGPGGGRGWTGGGRACARRSDLLRGRLRHRTPERRLGGGHLARPGSVPRRYPGARPAEVGALYALCSRHKAPLRESRPPSSARAAAPPPPQLVRPRRNAAAATSGAQQAP